MGTCISQETVVNVPAYISNAQSDPGSNCTIVKGAINPTLLRSLLL